MEKKAFATASAREMAVVAAVLALIAAACLRPSIHGVDGIGNYVYLASMIRGGDLDFTDEYAAFDAIKQYDFVTFAATPRHPQTGRPANRYGVGASILWSPFVLAAHFLTRLIAPEQADALGRPYEWAVAIGTAFWGSLGLWLLYRRLRSSFELAACAATTAALIFATPLGFYLYAHGSMSHGVSFFAVVGLMLSLERFLREPTPLLAGYVGCCAALVTIIRFQDAPWAAIAGLFLLARIMKSGPGFKSLLSRATIQFLTAAWVVSSIQMNVWYVLYGSYFSGPLPYLNAEAGSFSLFPRHLFGVLFAGRGGVLAWHPAIAIGLFGLVQLARGRGEQRPMAVFGLCGFAALLWLVSSWSIWWAGASFGNRFFISALPFIALGLTHWLSTGRRKIKIAALGILIVWNLGLLVQYATQMTPREQTIPWLRVVKQNIIDVPKFLIEKLAN